MMDNSEIWTVQQMIGQIHASSVILKKYAFMFVSYLYFLCFYITLQVSQISELLVFVSSDSVLTWDNINPSEIMALQSASIQNKCDHSKKKHEASQQLICLSLKFVSSIYQWSNMRSSSLTSDLS